MNYKTPYQTYITENTTKGSNKAGSYIKALSYLGPILEEESIEFNYISDIWTLDSIETIFNLYEYILIEQKQGSSGIFCEDYRPSYWRSGFYSAALKSYQQFLIEYKYENELLSVYDDSKIGKFEEKHFEKDIKHLDLLIKDFPVQKGKDAVRLVKSRLNQNVFRKKILQIYENQCCITGLDIPQVNRASHIIPWSEKEETRMDPTNGLCLSATYDAAFDKNLISLDEGYNIILSKNLKEHYTKDVVKQYFHNIEGTKIQMPIAFKPSQEHLEWHRKKLG